MLKLDEDHKAKVEALLRRNRERGYENKKIARSYECGHNPKTRKKPTQEQKAKRVVYAAAYYQKNKEKLDQQMMEKLQNPKMYKRHLLRNARNRAQKEAIPYSIVIKDIYWPTHCPVFGYPFTYKRVEGSAGKSKRWDLPSLDKIVPELGYVPGNVQVVSYRANTMKHNATEEQLKMFANWILDS